MARVSMFGKFKCVDGKTTEMEASLAAQAAAAEGADGCEAYSYHRGEDGTYYYFALFSDMESMQALSQTDAMQTGMAAFGPCLDGQPEMSMTTPL